MLTPMKSSKLFVLKKSAFGFCFCFFTTANKRLPSTSQTTTTTTIKHINKKIIQRILRLCGQSKKNKPIWLVQAAAAFWRSLILLVLNVFSLMQQRAGMGMVNICMPALVWPRRRVLILLVSKSQCPTNRKPFSKTRFVFCWRKVRPHLVGDKRKKYTGGQKEKKTKTENLEHVLAPTSVTRHAAATCDGGGASGESGHRPRWIISEAAYCLLSLPVQCFIFLCCSSFYTPVCVFLRLKTFLNLL